MRCDANRLLVWLFVCGIGCGQSCAQDRVELRPCQVEGIQEEVLCGSVSVPEDWKTGMGRTIDLRVVVVPALTEHPAQDPLFVIHGGPGLGATENMAFWASFFAPVRATRELVVVDVRGTGQSNPLRLPVDPQKLFDELEWTIPPSWVEDGLAGLAARADLTQYTTTAIAHDLEAVRRALGYQQINIYGTSYGCRVAQLYLRHYGDHVRSIVLKGVVPMNLVVGLDYAQDAQRSIDLLFEDCEADPACHSAFEDVRAHFDEVLERLDREPAAIDVQNPLTGANQSIELTATVFSGTVRMLLYAPHTQSMLPRLIEEAHAGRFQAWAPFVARTRLAYATRIYHGMALSVLAAEDLPRMTGKEISLRAEGTFLGDSAVHGLRDAAAMWPRNELEAGFFEPVESDVPALLISGGIDPATPPRWGEDLARHMPNSVHVIFEKAGHPGIGFQGCVEPIIAAFLESGSVVGLDTSCASESRRPAFETP